MVRLTDEFANEVNPQRKSFMSNAGQTLVRGAENIGGKVAGAVVDATVGNAFDVLDNIFARPIGDWAKEIANIPKTDHKFWNALKFLFLYTPATAVDIGTAATTSVVSYPAKLTLRGPLKYYRDFLNSSIGPNYNGAKSFWKALSLPAGGMAGGTFVGGANGALTMTSAGGLAIAAGASPVATTMMASAAVAPVADLAATGLSSGVGRLKNKVLSNREYQSDDFRTNTAVYGKAANDENYKKEAA